VRRGVQEFKVKYVYSSRAISNRHVCIERNRYLVKNKKGKKMLRKRVS